MSTTVGIDLAAAPKNTALDGINWAQDQAVVHNLAVGVEDDVVLHWMPTRLRPGPSSRE